MTIYSIGAISTDVVTCGRLAPSPTGAQHLGNARTYMLAWLCTRSVGGRIVLRMEDIDSPRVKPNADAQAVEDLLWLGFDWDEGPDLGGSNGPYVQTQRRDFYAAAIQRLFERNLIYPCTCSRTDVAHAASAPHLGQEGAIYPGTCATWNHADSMPEPGTYCWRYRLTDEVDEFEDLIRGEQTCNPSLELGDFPVTRKNGDPAYQLAVAVDDGLMGINQVIRGDDLLPSSFRQRLLQRSLGFPSPQYGHVPLVVGEDGRRLAKRHGDTRLATYREAGVPAQRIIGLLAWSAGLLPEPQPLDLRSLVSTFDVRCLPREPFVVTPQHEHWLLP